MKTIHIAEMIAQGGRDGSVEAPDGAFSVDLSSEEQPGNVTPEHLFAGAYAACFLGSLKNAMEKAHLRAEGVTVVGRARLEEDSRGRLPAHRRASRGTPRDQAHRRPACHALGASNRPCSKATRDNINVNLLFD